MTRVTDFATMATDRFGPFGGRYVPETLVSALDEVVAAYAEASGDPAFQAELADLSTSFVGRPTPCTTPGGSVTRSATTRFSSRGRI